MGRSRLLPLAWGADGVQQDCQRPGVIRHVVGLGERLPPIDVGREGPLSGGAVPDGQLAFDQDVQPVAPGVTVQDDLVARRLHHQRFPLLGSGRGCSGVRVPDAGALTERGAPRGELIALRPLKGATDLRQAMVVDKGFPAVHQ